jgi:hypothetical protein
MFSYYVLYSVKTFQKMKKARQVENFLYLMTVCLGINGIVIFQDDCYDKAYIAFAWLRFSNIFFALIWHTLYACIARKSG